jgi:hypothetical protein
MSAFGSKTPEPNLAARLVAAESEIASRRYGAGAAGDDVAVQRHGFRDLNEFLRIACSERLPTGKFASLLEIFSLTPTIVAEEAKMENAGCWTRPTVRTLIDHALREARGAGEPWIDDRSVDPRGAIKWFMGPRRRHLLPKELGALVETTIDREGSTGATPLVSASGPKPGQPSAKDTACKIAEAMLADDGARPPRHGRLTAIARTVLRAEAVRSYGESWAVKALRPTVRDWERKHPDK